jgi:hypothetical protein
MGIVNGVDVAMHVAGESAHDVLAGADMNSDVLIALGGGITLRVMKPDRRSHSAGGRTAEDSRARTPLSPQLSCLHALLPLTSLQNPVMPICRATGCPGSHSASFDHRRRPEMLRTAMAMAFFWPTSTTSRFPRVTPV